MNPTHPSWTRRRFTGTALSAGAFLSGTAAASAGIFNRNHPTNMKLETSSLTVRRSEERGHANHGWLKSHHSFSFADYYDPAHMGFHSLRVINEDFIAAKGGFPTHPHRDMEIFSYVVEGALAHKDSMGNGRVLKPGQIQLMSAGKGVTHSEFNPGDTPTHMLQIWIQPRERGLTPSYTEWHPDPATEDNAKVLVISSDGRDGSATLHQDADVYRLRVKTGGTASHTVRSGRGVWFQLIKGSVQAGDLTLKPGDALSTEDPGELQLTATADAEGLLFDLA